MANSRISWQSQALGLAALLSLPTSPHLGPQLDSTAWIMSGFISSCSADEALPNPSISLWPLCAQTANPWGPVVSWPSGAEAHRWSRLQRGREGTLGEGPWGSSQATPTNMKEARASQSPANLPSPANIN